MKRTAVEKVRIRSTGAPGILLPVAPVAGKHLIAIEGEIREFAPADFEHEEMEDTAESALGAAILAFLADDVVIGL